ncbi:MAG: 50S ribosomal protein L11 methyltransferase [Gemmatimonadota bacterium]
MIWWALEVRGAGADRERVAWWLVRETGQAVEERPDGVVVGFFTDRAAAEALASGVSAECRSALAQVVAVPDVDWSSEWKRGLGPRRVGRLTITPSWISAPADPFTIVIDPETAFGTGEHGSTRAALALLDRLMPAGARVLDLGSGSGILAMAAVRLGARSALGIEIDEDTLVIAEQNAARNGLADRVRFVIGDAAVLAPLAGPADVVLSNILRVVNLTLLEPIRAALAPGGLAIFAGMETPEAATFRTALDRHGYTVIDDVVDADWWAVAGRPA